jgi:hypothetical protein
MKSPPHPAILYHPNLGVLRRIDSFTDAQRMILECNIIPFHMRCIHLNSGRYIIVQECDDFSICDSVNWDVDAIERDYAKSFACGSYDFPREACQEMTGHDQYASRQKASLERISKAMLTITGPDHVLVRSARVYSFWRDAAVVAGQFATPENANAFNHAVTAFETALLSGRGHEHALVEFHYQLLAMASPTAVANFEQFWPHCRLQLKPGFNSGVVSKFLRRLRATINGWRGEPYGADTPASTISEYLCHCTF